MKLIKEVSKNTGNLGSSEGAGKFSEDGIPKKISVGDVWMNLHKSPPERSRQLEGADQQDTLMGRLASRMASRDMIDELDLGPKGRASESKKAMVADDDIPRPMRVEGPALQKGTDMEKEHTKDTTKAKKIAKDHLEEYPKYYDEEVGLPAMEKKLKKNEISADLMPGAGLHQQTTDLKASNFSNPIHNNSITPGSNMADQAKYQGNVYDTMHKVETTQQKVLGKLR